MMDDIAWSFGSQTFGEWKLLAIYLAQGCSQGDRGEYLVNRPRKKSKNK